MSAVLSSSNLFKNKRPGVLDASAKGLEREFLGQTRKRMAL
jgi:hypothetical protein